MRKATAASTVGVALMAFGLCLAGGPAAATALSASTQDSGTCPSPTTQVNGSAIAEALLAGDKVFCSGVTITGNIDLTSADQISVPLALLSSVIKGNVSAPAVIFEDTIDFSGTRFEGELDFRGATMERDARWTGATLLRCVNARSARFGQAFDISGVTAEKDVFFPNAVFAEDAVATSSIFRGSLVFTNARFQGDARFSRTRFEADKTDKDQTVLFNVATVAGDADFAITSFGIPANFAGASIGGDLDFIAAHIYDSFTLDDVSAGSMRLIGNSFDEGEQPLFMNNVDFRVLEMDLDTVDRIGAGVAQKEQQLSVLRAIEESARSSGKTQLANEASFDRQVLENRDRPAVIKAGWFFFGEQVTGYLVKPWRPLRALAAIAVAATITRAGFGIGPSAFSQALPTRKRTILILKEIISGGVASFKVAIRPDTPKVSVGPIEDADPIPLLRAGGRWVEWGVQKGLNLAFVTALANAVPGVKEIIDTILD